MDKHSSFSIAPGGMPGMTPGQRGGIITALSGVALLLTSFSGVQWLPPVVHLSISLILIAIGTIWFAAITFRSPANRNNGTWQRALTNRGIWGWAAGILLTLFYILLYWFPETLGFGENNNTGFMLLFDPLARFFKGDDARASQWFMYGTLYTAVILILGIRFLIKYRDNRYQIIRTSAVILSQLGFAYLIPEILEGLNTEQPYFSKDLKNFWPLNYYFFDGWHLDNMQAGGSLGMFYLVWGIAGFAIITPLLTYFLGKRWYCSWVCGCGGLAETAGDSFRHLSSKKMSAWKIERWMIHGVLAYIVLVTAVVLYGYFTGVGEVFGMNIYHIFQKPYGFLIGAMFSGVIGVGFYPVMGSRVWCRFGCPLAAYMGLFQRFKSRFRISVNGAQCISCGNCSTYCEQGIDVRSYAQRGTDVVRASCVGCGICATVCPRGVLKLENGPADLKKENMIG
ncbi:MAG: 4Fe-4S binding protein [Flavobacteriales bacterium]|nr:4Fe-4S binding protein [Flavobacteriales bacterium]